MKRIITYEGYLDEAKLGQCLAELFPIMNSFTIRLSREQE